MERAEKLVRLVTEGSISQLLLFAEEKITLVSHPYCMILHDAFYLRC
jgi:hypothetical protein